MLKNSTSTGNVADLARNMMNLNTKWTNFYKKADAKYKYIHELHEFIDELKRKSSYFLTTNMFEYERFYNFIELLEEERQWLDKVQSKVNQTRIGADAEELSEELDVCFLFYINYVLFLFKT